MSGFGLFNIFPFLFMLLFSGVVGLFVYTIVNSVKKKRRNDASPRLTVEAVVVTKRTQVHGHRGSSNTMGNYSTYYFATFQVQSGDRMELAVEPYDYGMLVEGDRGRLTFQGSRFLSFERT